MELLLLELFNKRILIWQVITRGLCAYLMDSDIQLRLSIFRALTILMLVPIRISSIGHEIVTHIKIGTCIRKKQMYIDKNKANNKHKNEKDIICR